MIFKKNIDINLDEKIIKKNKIPILTKDKTWQYIRENCKNRAMDSLAKDLQLLISQETNYQKLLKELKEKKRLLMNKVINLSDLVNTKGEEQHISEIEQSKTEIEKINGEIDKTLEIIFEYPQKIEQINLQLLRETLKVAYQNVITDQLQIDNIDKEILTIREKLGNLREEKESIQKRVDILYSFLHGLVGREEMEKLDMHSQK